MKRASVLGIAFAAMRAPAAAQPAGRTYRVGILFFDTLTAMRPYFDAFRTALAALGYREGQNIEFVVRDAVGNQARFSALARELVQTRPDVMVAGTAPTIAALKRATSSIPIVMANIGDPVSNGLVAALNRPGGNVTGVSNMGVDLVGKQLQLLKELVPHLSLVVILEDATLRAPLRERAAQRDAKRLGLQSIVVQLGSPSALDRLAKPLPHPENLGALASAQFPSNATRIIRLVAERRLPTIYEYDEFVTRGGLISYGPSEIGLWRQAAGYVDRILKGAKAADLPVQQPTTFDLAVNLKTAHALGITVPQSILLQATQVIR